MKVAILGCGHVGLELGRQLESSGHEAIGDGTAPELRLEEAAQIQALAEGTPDAETIVTMACEHLLLGMSSAVLDVEALESELEIDLEAKEIQQKIERRTPMTFEEFVYLQHAIADGMP